MVTLQQIAYRVMFIGNTILGSINLQGNLQGNMTVDISLKFKVAPKLCECPEEK